MASEIKLPELGENLTQGEVLQVKVAPGDTVTEGQALVEIEAEKATVEVPSPVAGKVGKVLVKKGDTVSVGQTVCTIDGEAGEKDGAKATPVRQAPSTAAEPEPKAAERQAEITEPAETGGENAEQPATTPVPSAVSPVEDGRDKKATKPASSAREREEAKAQGKEKPEVAEEPPTHSRVEEARPAKAAQGEPVVPAGPATRQLARELGVDLSQVTGTAPAGRVTQEDVKAYVRDLVSRRRETGRGTAAPQLPDFERWGPVERQPFEGIRRKTAEHTGLAWSQIPHVTQHDQADINDLETFRKQQEGQGPKLTVTAFALKAAAIALKQYPQFNSSLDPAAGELIVKKYIHIAVAVDTEYGLLVPVLRDVDKKGVRELAKDLTDLAEKARQKKLHADDMRGGTFTITNLGGIGGTGFTPIINHPEVAILGLARSRLQPVVRDGQVTPRLLLPLSLSYDHRVIDGANAARFTRRIAELLENPMMMLL
jgi:pyruvate dehydrogenase E2 component (dihydrolipoamide acetyltransferase)